MRFVPLLMAFVAILLVPLYAEANGHRRQARQAQTSCSQVVTQTQIVTQTTTSARLLKRTPIRNVLFRGGGCKHR